jgi:hypothetical protein
MGTRCITRVKDEHGRELLALYRQYDGYPDAHGKELIDFLSKMRMVNGLTMSHLENTANGMGCLAAQIVAYFKNEPGGFYIEPPGCPEEDYDYEVSMTPKNKLIVKIDGKKFWSQK